MGKPKRSSRGFSSPKHTALPQKQFDKLSADFNAKEQQAIALINQNKLQEAEAIYRDLIESGSNNHIIYGNLAAICGMQGRLDEVIEILKKTLHLKPNYPDAHNNLGNALKEKGHLNAAIDAYNKALELEPYYSDAYYNLGNALKEKGDLNAAVDAYNKALELKPNYAAAHYNLGIALKEKGHLNAAIDAYNKAIELKPNYSDAHNNLGIALTEKGKLSAAINSYNKALALQPNCPETHWNYALTLLLDGDYKNGLAKYGWRFKREKDSTKLHATPNCKPWSDSKTLNQTNQLLLVTEQGLGDTLQFMRYAIALRNQSISISLCAQPKLHSLIQASGIDPSPLTPAQANNISTWQWAPLLSIPHYLNVSPDNPIITEPYIKTKEELILKWKMILSAEKRPIIGINWQGNPRAEKSGLLGRSLPLETFSPIAHCCDAVFLSLQKGFGSEQLETCSFKEHFVGCQPQVNETWDFLETAAIIANCDLVITSDTSVAHLSGGMGQTTWLLLKKVPDWRWGLEGETTFWYPSMRLFRQTQPGDWESLIQTVAAHTREFFYSTTGN